MECQVSKEEGLLRRGGMGTQIEALQKARLDSWGEINRYRLQAVLRHAGRSILDVGCSTGAYVTYLNAVGYRAYGLDVLPDSTWTQRTHHRYVTGTARELPLTNNAVDTILAFEVLEHVPQAYQALAEFRRVCRQNIILSVPDCETPEDILRAGMTYAHWRDPSHGNFFTTKSLRQMLEKARFQVHSITHINPILPDFLALRSFYVPFKVAYFVARVLRHIPFRKQYCMTLLAVAHRI